MTNTKHTKKQDLKHHDCTALLEEIRKKVQELKEFGMSEKEIMASLHNGEPLMKLIISRNYRLFLGDERMEIHMEPLVKAVYLLFLKHPEGIVFKLLPDYRKELTSIYGDLKPLGLNDRVIRSIEDVTNPLLNSINEKCSRIRAAFISEVEEPFAKEYYVTGKSGAAKKISLPRDLVIWE